MTKFVKITDTDGDDAFINIALITLVREQASGAVVISTADPDTYVITEMSLQRVMQEIRAAELTYG